MLATAGAGKTYHICRSINPEKKNLLLAFTNENIKNIKRELIDAHGDVPKLTNVMTFDSFVYKYLLCPYEPSILKYFGQEDFIRKGITLKKPPPQRIRNEHGAPVYNPFYIKQDKLRHYVKKTGHYSGLS